jgi:ARG and Rhodanese-Phosphatase-superfamily-associated Protein domain
MLRRQLKIFAVLSFAFPILFGGVLLMTNADPSVRASGGDESASRKGWRLAEGVTYENLTIFPVVASKQPDTSGFATLDEALARGDAVVTEQGNYLRRTRDGVMEPLPQSGAQVNQLVLVNRGKKPLILLAGEVVSGGKQDRIIGKDRIVPAGAPPLPLSVFCVERGRWTDVSTSFSAAKMMAHPSVREKAAVEQDQSQVWATVRGGSTYATRSSPSASAGASGSGSGTATAAPAPAVSESDLRNLIASAAPTESYPKMMQSGRVGASVENFAEQMQRRFERATKDLKGERLIGVVVAFGGEVAWSDVFASSELFDAYWPKLLRSYAVEAVMRPPTRQNASLDDARDFIRPAVGHTKEETDPGVYRWREIIVGRTTEIELESLEPTTFTLHWLRVTRS